MNGGAPRPRPPGLATWLLGRVLPPGTRAASIAGDLLEEFEADVAARSRLVAAGRYWRHALSIAVRYAFRRRHGDRAIDHTGLHLPVARRGFIRFDTFRDDLRHAVRSLVKNPGFALVAVLTLAVGVGANTAIFSVLQAVVLKDLPYHDADRLVVLWTLKLGQNSRDGSSYLNVRDWREQSRTLEDVGVYQRTMSTRATLTGGREPQRVYRGLVGPSLFQVLGAPALLGRTLDASDFESDNRAVVISHGLWRQRFAGDPSIIGKSIDIDGAGCAIVGVMASDFGLLMPDVQLWQPMTVSARWQRLHDPRSRWGTR